jgi:hypothetical protein
MSINKYLLVFTHLLTLGKKEIFQSEVHFLKGLYTQILIKSFNLFQFSFRFPATRVTLSLTKYGLHHIYY